VGQGVVGVVGKRGVRVVAAAFALGVSLVGPQAAGVAVADSTEADSSTVSAGNSPKREKRGAVPRTARTSARNAHASPAGGSGDSSSPSVAADSATESFQIGPDIDSLLESGSEPETVVAPEPELEVPSALGGRGWREAAAAEAVEVPSPNDGGSALVVDSPSDVSLPAATRPGPAGRDGSAAVPEPEVLPVDDVEIATPGRVFAVRIPVVAEVPGSPGASEAASAAEPSVVSVIAPQTPVMTAAVPAEVSARDEVSGLGSDLSYWLGAGGRGDAPAAAPLMWTMAAASRRELGTAPSTAKPAAATTSGASPAGSLVGTQIGNPLQDFIRIFIGDGTAANPDAGLLIGTGYSWTAQTCNQGAACTGGKAGVLWGSGGSGWNGGNGGSAGLLGSGGAGGAGIAEVNGGAGGAGGRGGLLWGDNGSDGADWVAPVFTTSNQLPAGGTILALPIASTEIGVLRSFLQSVPGVSQSYIDASKGGLDFTLDVLEVPEGTSFYKALKIPPSGLFPQNDVLNTFAVSTNWYSSLEVAQAYADSPWGQSQGYQVVAFEAPKPLKLIDLGDDDTLGYVWAGLESDIRWTEAQLARLQGEDPPTTNPEAIVVVTQQLAELRQDMAIVQLTTGYNASYATQLELLLQYGDAITNDFSYNPATEIVNRGIAPGDTFIVEVAEIANTWQPASLVTGFATDPGGAVTWGGSVDDLNRISFTTAIDKELTSIIGTYLNVDGYYAGELPSLFHRDGRLIEEIALFIPRDSTAIVAQAA
jgi:hypothetical protein